MSETSEIATESTCRHCGRTITNGGGPTWAHIIGPGSLLIRCEPSESGKPYGLNAEPVDELEHDITYSWPHPDLFRADCSCGWVRASPDRDAVEADIDEHEKATGDGIDWAEVARDDRDRQDQDARDLRTEAKR